MDLITPGFGLLFWNIITFVTVFFLLSKFAWKPILAALQEREDTITDALKSAELAKVEMANLQAQNAKLLDEARVERDKMLKDAQTASVNLIEEAKNKANIEGNRLIEAAKSAINSEKNAALAEVRGLAAEISVNIAEKILKKELNNDTAQKDLVKKYLEEVN